MKLHLDFETYSAADLKTTGVHKYVSDPSFSILMVAYAIGESPVIVVDLTEDDFPTGLAALIKNQHVIKCAHNASFERLALAAIGIHTPAQEWECSMIKASYCGFPASLTNLSAALGLGDKGKLASGKELIRYFCLPQKPSKKNTEGSRRMPTDDPEKWQLFMEYCRQDVEAERAVCEVLAPIHLPASEKLHYVIDQQINDTGVAVDLNFVKSALIVHEHFKKIAEEEFTMLTGLPKANSLVAMTAWLSSKLNRVVKSVDKGSVEDILNSAPPDEVSQALALRKKLSRSSIAKYVTMQKAASNDGRARGCIQFYGAKRTGRWAGRRIQPQNLSRNYLPELQQAREAVQDRRITALAFAYQDIPEVLAQLVRTALVAKEGCLLVSVDFSAIEARVLAWLSGEKWRLDVFASHGKIYEASASKMFSVPIEEVTPGSKLRSMGKVAELALGYGGKVGALKQMGADKMGLSDTELNTIADKWRRNNPSICAFWRAVDRASVRAVQTGQPTQIGALNFYKNKEALAIRLPSGRELYYQKAKIGPGTFGQPCVLYKNTDSDWAKGTFTDTYGGKLAENITQAVARDILAYAVKNVHTEVPHSIVFHVHDEIVLEVPKEQALDTLGKVKEIMAERPVWGLTLPLAAAGFVSPHYKK